EMVITGVLLRELYERIINLSSDGTPEGRLARRVCGLIFLISKLPTEAGAHIGVRATKEHIADLLVNDLNADNGKLRADVEKALEKLTADGVLMQLGDEYRLQTKEGADWDREFRNRQTKLMNDEATIQIRRDALLYAEVNEIVRSVKLLHGAAKELRHIAVYRDQTPPPDSSEAIAIWVRDQWSSAEKDITSAARSAGSDSPTIFAFILRQSAGDLKRLIVDADAAQQTLEAKGATTTLEGMEAKRSLESRRDLAVQNRDALIKEIVGNTKVFQGGGNEMLQASLAEKIREAANASLVRLFPRFKEADSSKWEAVIRRARDGADQPFEPVGHLAATEQHAVCQQVLAMIGAGKTGAEVRKALQASPLGWPKDAIDSALIALHRLQHLSATLNGVSLVPGQLDQNKIPKAEFRIEKAMLTVKDRLALRGLFQKLGISCKGGEEAAKAPEFLSKLLGLASSAGGAAPLPPVPDTTAIQDIQRLVGNEQLASISAKLSDFEARIEAWTKAKQVADERKPVWELVERLARHAVGIPAAAEHLEQVEGIRSGQMLLEPTDPVAPIRAGLSGILRKAVKETLARHTRAYDDAESTLDDNTVWAQVPETDRARILTEVGLVAPVEDRTTTDDALVASLDARPLASRQAEIDAIAGRVQRALERAAKLLEPKVRPLAIERVTLRSEEDVRGWLSRQEVRLLEAVKNGPVLVN
ncbi:MAG TPA: BREX system P-loop protein BrxC, partial [Blastocatellia bacterium]